MKIDKLLMGMGILGAFALTACQSDEPNATPDIPTNGDGETYLAVRLMDTASSRANAGGFENGEDYE